MKKTTQTYALYQLAEDPGRTVDRQNATIDGVVSMQVGEAIGHGIYADPTTLQLTRVLSNASSGGVSGRFGHPGMSENATGKKLARGRNFRVDGDSLRFDMHLLESARKSPSFSQDPVDYMLTVAELNPTELGMSYVLYTDLVWTLADGSERELTDEERFKHQWGELEPPENASPQMPVMRPTEVAFLDIVNEGALTSNGDGGMFEMSIAADIFAGRSSAFLVELYGLMDRFRAQYKMPLDQMASKADYILDSYIQSRQRKDEMARRKKVSLETVPELEGAFDSAVVADDDAQDSADDGAAEDELPVGDADGEDAGGPVDGDLDNLEEEMSVVLSDIAAAPEETPVTVGQFHHLQSQVAHLLGTTERQQSEIKRLTSLLKQSLQAVQILHRNQERLAGEPVVTEVADPNPKLGMEQFAFGHPSPMDALDAGMMVKPKAARSRPLTQKEIKQRNFEINARRQQVYGTPSNG